MPMQIYRIIILVIAVPILSCLAMVAFIILKPTYIDYSSRVPFDKQIWLSANSWDAKPNRVNMIDDLLSKNDFHGKRKSDVIALLGEPPKPEKFHDWDMVYWLGPERGFMSIDSEWLVFYLDTNARVIDYQIVRD